MTTRALFASSRGGAPTVSFGAAVLQGLAPDGGLYVPLSWPHLAPPDFDGVSELPAIAGRLLAPFLEGDPLARELAPLAAEALDFPAPLVPLAPAGRMCVLAQLVSTHRLVDLLCALIYKWRVRCCVQSDYRLLLYA